MKPIRITWCLAAAALVLGCEQTTEPTAQANAIDQPAFGAEHVDFLREGTWNDLIYYPCLNDGEGEMVWERGVRVDFKGRVYAPSGNANRWTWPLEVKGLPPGDPYYFGPDYTILGLESGDVWKIDQSRSTGWARRHDKKDGFVYAQQFNLRLFNQDGEKIHVLDKYNSHCDYDWNCTHERVGGTCPTEWIDSGLRQVVEETRPISLAADVEPGGLFVERLPCVRARAQIDLEYASRVSLDHRILPARVGRRE